MDSWPVPAVALAAALAMMTLVWLGSLVRRDASIGDVLMNTVGTGTGVWLAGRVPLLLRPPPRLAGR